MRRSVAFSIVFSFVFVLAACQPAAPTPTPLSGEIIMYGWAADFPTRVLESFEAETGVSVRYEIYESQEALIDQMRTGTVADVIILENQLLPLAASEGLLHPIDAPTLNNFRNISPNFRDLVFNPGNEYGIPYSWGTTGILYPAAQSIASPVSWDVLWDEANRGNVVVWAAPRYLFGVALLSLGYSINTEDEAEVQAGIDRLMALAPNVHAIVSDAADMASTLEANPGMLGLGFAGDLRMVTDPAVLNYALPDEGTLLWGDNYAVPTRHQNLPAALAFLDYVMRPEIAAEIVLFNNYPTPNDAARAVLPEAVANNPLIFPDLSQLRRAELLLPINDALFARYNAAYEAFVVAVQDSRP